MFKQIKEQVDILRGLEFYLGMEMVECGTDTFEPEDKTCPLCLHKDCFKAKITDEGGIWSCFSECGVEGDDLISFVQKLKGVEAKEAGELIGKDFNIDLPRQRANPKAELFEAAADYYHNCLMETCIKKEPILGNLTPLEYQLEVRGHEKSVLKDMKIGWSDGELLPFLRSMGFDEDLIQESGLVRSTGKKDFLPTKAFIYPHRIGGHISRFTFKNPDPEAKAYQMPKKSFLNNPQFYNQNCVSKATVILVVEGENDLLSIKDAGWTEGVIAAIGQLGGQQVSWLVKEAEGKHIITVFDNDGAGDKYRKTMQNAPHNFASLTHVVVPEKGSDIDEWLRNGNNLEETLKNETVAVEMSGKARALDVIKSLGADPLASEKQEVDAKVEDEADSSAAGGNSIFEHDGCYYKTVWIDNQEKLKPVTNFTIQLLNVFEKSGEKNRQIVVKTKNGRRSEPLHVNSADKVSLKPFKTLMANAADASFYGSEADLTRMWEYIYDSAKPGYVWISDTVGVVRRHNGWLFDDCFIDKNGVVHTPDEEGIMWMGGRTRGIKARSLNADDISSEGMDVPSLDIHMPKEEREEMLGGFVQMLAQNLGSPGMALTMIGWAWANAYSNDIFKLRRFFPFLYMWGRHGKGKTNLVKWLLALYNMDECGYTTVGNLKSAVGFERKAAFYDSLPMAVDELRADRNTARYYEKFRGWYNRTARTMGTKEGMEVRVVPVRANFVFCGQDIFTDSAAAERCITLQIPTNGRETVHSYKWIENVAHEFSAIGYGWILEAVQHGPKRVMEGIDEVDELLKDACPSARTRFQWGIAGHFGLRLRDAFMPEFDYEGYLKTAAADEASEIQEGDVLLGFLEYIEGLCVGERPHITNDHIGVDEGVLFIWFAEVFNIVQRHRRAAQENLEPFSKKALHAGFRDEKWFIDKKDRMCLGITSTQRRGIAFDMLNPSCPDVVKRIASTVTGSG